MTIDHVDEMAITPMKNAPIALFTYNRLWHTRQTVETLAANDLACETDLFVFSDAARSVSQEAAVQEVRDYIRTVTGFRSVSIVEREENLGLARSIIEGVTALVAERGRVIVLEDDLKTSRYFLRYMNDALEFYQEDERVASIHGYIYPVQRALPETFFLRGADCWGWATWKRAWDLFEPDGKKLFNELKKRNLLKEFDFNGAYRFSGMLEDQYLGRNASWAIRWYASAFLADKLTLYPGRSLVQNIGNDASGTHCGESRKYDVVLASAPVHVKPVEVTHDRLAFNAVSTFFASLKPTFWGKVKKSISKRVELIASAHTLSRSGYFGNYSSWEEAQKDSEGYDADLILEKVKSAMLKVRDGKAAFERDSVLFDKIEYSWPLLTALLWIASRHGNNLKIIDFGGSLGSSYYQNVAFLKHLEALSWNVVEQGSFVACGNALFANEHLHFYYSIEACLSQNHCDALLLASVLPYLEKPYKLLEEVVAKGFHYVIIDRTPVLQDSGDRLTVQRVPEQIYHASYPAWFLSEAKLVDFFVSSNYELMTEFDSLVHKIRLGATLAKEKGFVFVKKGSLSNA